MLHTRCGDVVGLEVFCHEEIVSGARPAATRVAKDALPFAHRRLSADLNERTTRYVAEGTAGQAFDQARLQDRRGSPRARYHGVRKTITDGPNAKLNKAAQDAFPTIRKHLYVMRADTRSGHLRASKGARHNACAVNFTPGPAIGFPAVGSLDGSGTERWAREPVWMREPERWQAKDSDHIADHISRATALSNAQTRRSAASAALRVRPLSCGQHAHNDPAEGREYN